MEERINQTPTKRGLPVSTKILIVIAIFFIGVVAEKISAEFGPQKYIPSSSACVDDSTANINSATYQTADWKTYTNEEYGFTFKYPAHWKLDRDTNIMGYKNLVELTSPDTNLAFHVSGNAGHTVDFVIHYEKSIADQVENKAYNLNASTIEELLQRSTTLKKVGTTTIGDQTATLAQGSTEVGHRESYTIMLERNKHIWEIQTKSDGKSDQYPIEKHILSTFQFTK